ncbi:MAG: hypothetical protein P8P81_05810 [Bacteroidia bacterium]|nr:hypothetical protein [Bacteroidia bacterium]
MTSKLLKLTIVSLLSFTLINKYSNKIFDAENFALGNATSSHFATHNNFPIHLNKLIVSDIDRAVEGWKISGKDYTTLVLGNSQTHSINQFKKGQNTFIQSLHLKDTISYVFCHSIQNANIQHFLLSLTFLKHKLNVKKVVVPLFFDDFREDGIRDIFYPSAIEDQFLIDNSLHPVISEINSELKSYWKVSNTDDIKDTYVSSQSKTENYLDSLLSNNFKLWSLRSNTRTRILTDLYQLRNYIFNINAQTIRNKIPFRYMKNLNALESILIFCDQQNIAIYLYIPPIRSDVPIPYDISEYEEFKSDISSILEGHNNVSFSNFEHIVPSQYWGMKAPTDGGPDLEYDFMHFRYEGHQILDSAITQLLKLNNAL